MDEVEKRSITLAEAKAGVRLKAGHSVVLVLGHSFEIHAQLHAAGGTPLVKERVRIEDPDTGVVIGIVTADETGVVRARVPKEKDYHFFLETAGAAAAEPDPFAGLLPPPVAADDPHAVLSFALIDSKGKALADTKLQVKAPDGTAHEEVTDSNGHLLLAVSPGAFQIVANGAAFVAHTLFASEIEGDAPPYQFVVP